MDSIIGINQLKIFAGLPQNKKTVLIGGCFDVLHPGHIVFLEKAKKTGDILIILLESDKKIKKLKGKMRPVHTQLQRAKVLAAVKFVDYIVLLPFIEKEIEYDEIIKKISPQIIAATKNVAEDHYKRSARMVGAKLKYVTRLVGKHSSSRIIGSRR